MDKKYKFLIIGLFIYLAIMLLILYIININNVEILISPNISIKYEAKKYKKIEFNSNLRYNIYVDNNFVSNDLLIKDDYTFYLNNEVIKNMISISNNKAKIIPYNKEELINTEFEKVLSDLNITKYHDMTIAVKILIDYDNDKDLEEINVISNVFVDPFMEDIDDDKFSIIYTVDNNETNIIYNKKFSSDMKGCLLSEPYIIDLNKDNKYEIITTCSYFDALGTKVQIFEQKKNKYNLVKEL